MRIRFYLGGAVVRETIFSSEVPNVGERLAIDGVVRIVDGRFWEFWTGADTIVNLYLSSVRGPKPTLKKTKGKKAT